MVRQEHKKNSVHKVDKLLLSDSIVIVLLYYHTILIVILLLVMLYMDLYKTGKNFCIHFAYWWDMADLLLNLSFCLSLFLGWECHLPVCINYKVWNSNPSNHKWQPAAVYCGCLIHLLLCMIQIRFHVIWYDTLVIFT